MSLRIFFGASYSEAAPAGPVVRSGPQLTCRTSHSVCARGLSVGLLGQLKYLALISVGCTKVSVIFVRVAPNDLSVKSLQLSLHLPASQQHKRKEIRKNPQNASWNTGNTVNDWKYPPAGACGRGVGYFPGGGIFYALIVCAFCVCCWISIWFLLIFVRTSGEAILGTQRYSAI